MSPAQQEEMTKTEAGERKGVGNGNGNGAAPDGAKAEGAKEGKGAEAFGDGEKPHGRGHGNHAEDVPKDLHKPGPVMIIGMMVLLAVVVVGMFLIGYVPHHKAEEQAKGDAEAIKSEVPVVTVAKPEKSAGFQELSFFCDVTPNQETLVYPRTTGYLKKLYVDIQDKVKAGQVLADIDAQDVDARLAQSVASLAQSKADVVKAQSDLELAQRTYDRYRTATVSGQGLVVTKQELDEKLTARDTAASALAQANANVGVAEANVQQLQVLQGFEKVVAPFDGVITERKVDVGAYLTPANSGAGQYMFRLVQSDTLRVFVNIPQADASNVHIGQEATLTVRNYPGRLFTGTVARMAGAVDAATRTMPFELDFVNKDGALYAGMYGEARLKVTDSRPTLLVPTSALIFNAAGVQLATVEDGKNHFQKVLVGRDLGTKLEILDGINEDDEIVTNPGTRLMEGGAVDVKRPAAAAGAAPASGQTAAK